MVQGDDLLGDGVNIAARLEGLAAAGGICLSRAVFEQVRAALPLDYRALGEKRLKNIAQPVAAYSIGTAAPIARRKLAVVIGAAMLAAALVAGGVFWWMRPAWDGSNVAAAGKPSIAVLPFDNLSGNLEETYFSDGMTEDLITDLSKVSGLMVIARNSSFAYRGKTVSIATVGRELGVRYVVEGSVRREGDRIRITAQLIDASNDAHIWAERYDREMKAIFDLQDDVRQKIVAALAVKLAPGESERLAQKPTNNIDAYDYWARGLALESRFTPEDNAEARRMFMRAIEIDPKFARAYGQVANTYANESNLGWTGLEADSLSNGLKYAERAVAMDDSQPEAHWTLAYAYSRYNMTDKARAQLEKAIALNPNYADGEAYYALMLAYDNRVDDARRHIEKAMRINPRFPGWYLTILGDIEYLSGHYEKAVANLKQALERNPNWQPARRILIAAYGELGRLDDAQWEIAEARTGGAVLTLSNAREISGYQDGPALTHLIEGLRKAGVPE
jgi:adenylate cyclase